MRLEPPALATTLILCSLIGLTKEGHCRPNGGFHVQSTASAPPSAPVPSPEERLALLLTTRAYGSVDAPDIGEAEYFGARGLSTMALALTQDLASVWRLRLALADADISDPTSEEVARTALDRLAVLEPMDQVVRLRRVLEAVARKNDAPSRIIGYRKVLAPKSLAAIGDVEGARIAYDLALLESRVGDRSAFASDILRSAELDPYYPAAADASAGFVAGSEMSVTHHADLLVRCFIANPSDENSLSRLAALLMAQRAWSGVPRVMAIALTLAASDALDSSITDGFAVEYALALWAQGDGGAAMKVLQDYSATRNETYRMQLVSSGFDLTQEAIDKELAPRSPELEVAYAAISAESELPQAQALRAELVQGLKAVVGAAKRESDRSFIPDAQGKLPDAAAVAFTLSQIQAQSLNLWFALSLLRADANIVDADTDTLATAIELMAPLPDSVKARMAAFKDLANGEPAKALSGLEAIASVGALESLASGIALQRLGRNRDAAARYKLTYESSPGTIIGVSAERHLAKLLGIARIPAGPEDAGLSAKVAAIPIQLDRAVETNASIIGYEIKARKSTTKPFEPIMVDLIVSNNLNRPIAIEPSGPLRPLVTLAGEISAPNTTGTVEVDTSILRIDRRLRLDPGEKMIIPLDLRTLPNIEGALASEPLLGALLEVHSYLNFITTGRTLRPGALGSESRSRTLLIDPTPLTDKWVADAIAISQQPLDPEFLPTMALLAHAAATDEVKTTDTDIYGRSRRAWQAFTAAWQRCSSVEKAWLVAVGPALASGFTPFFQEAVSSDDGYLRVVAALHAKQSTDPALNAQSIKDRAAREVVEGIRARVTRVAAGAANERSAR